MTKAWWKSKTLWFNVIAVAAAVAAYLDSLALGGALAIGIGVVNVILRFVTSTALVVKE